jgi:hypothetical protein
MLRTTKRIRRYGLHWLLVLCGCLLLTSAGCGGDAYEKQFDDSLKHLKATGLPLGKEPAPPADATPPADQGTAGNAQPQPQPPQN